MESTSRQKAVAMHYSLNEFLPKVTAKGQGAIAQTIIRLANENGVFVHQSPELVSLLLQVDLDERIPLSLYLVVAELLAWVYALESGLSKHDAAS